MEKSGTDGECYASLHRSLRSPCLFNFLYVWLLDVESLSITRDDCSFSDLSFKFSKVAVTCKIDHGKHLAGRHFQLFFAKIGGTSFSKG